MAENNKNNSKQPEKKSEKMEKKRNGFKRGKKIEREKPEFEQQMVDLARVTRVTKGGKQLSFRALVVIGDKKGKVSYGLAKGKDVTLAVGKAVDKAKKQMIKINLTEIGSIPHEVRHKFGAAKILLKPAPKGTGVKAGSAVRVVLDMAGVENVVGKIMGTNNKINNVKCVYEALKLLKEPRKETKNEKLKTHVISSPDKIGTKKSRQTQ